MASSNLSLRQQVAKECCESSHLDYTRYFFKVRQTNPFRVNWHHELIADGLQGVMDGKIENLLITVAPGSSKTEEAVINFMSRGLAINHYARFLHLSYSDDLALQNSFQARDLVQSDEYQELWPLKISDDAKSKKRWNVMVNGKVAGGVYATSLGGQITGFRAGHMAPGFQGAIIIDDPLKPEDAYNEVNVEKANRRLVSTVKSRRACPETPIILIMQRVAERDPAGFILSGGLGGKWTHINIPALIDEEYVAKLPEHLQAKVEREAPDRFSYWPYKEPTADLLAMEQGLGSDESGKKMSRHVFSSQYQQAPKAIGGNLIRGSWFPRYKVLPKIIYRMVYSDTAQKIKKRNDYSVLGCFGFGENGKLYLLDLMRGKWEAPALEANAKAFWAKHNVNDPQLPWVENHAQVPRWCGTLRRLCVEDKSSGTGLIQKIRLENRIPIEDIQRNIDKLTRVMDAQAYLEQGFVEIPEEAPFTADFVSECEAFTADDSHDFDDQVDVLCDAVQNMLSPENNLDQWRSLK